MKPPGNVRVTVTIEGHDGVCYMRSDILGLPDDITSPAYCGPEGTFTDRDWELREVRRRVGNAFHTAFTSWSRAREAAL